MLNVSIAELGWAVSKALASLHWYGLRVGYSGADIFDDGILQPPIINMRSSPTIVRSHQPLISEHGTATIMVLETRYRLNLSLVPLMAGIVASIIMLLVFTGNATHSLLSAKMTAGDRIVIGSIGILQIAWLSGNEPHLVEVSSSDLNTLRAAGMFASDMSQDRGDSSPEKGPADLADQIMLDEAVSKY
ncbi:hypothetical protein PsYK624_152050 [Phanerochaete sordida]|uniref:Uncharacterized protein n=1 Tax=Phanerochaete sordida TaxID=48140 RepID=A0A9P3LM41_9APHY|nr:hypothetical protein PsYK624_152050 [Phanerochaete sordida]